MKVQAGSVREEPPAGIFLTLEELSTLFPLLKKNEPLFTGKERRLFTKIEKKLYDHLSIAELENSFGRTD